MRTGVAARLHAPGDPLRYPWGVEYRDSEGLRAIADQLPGKPFVALHPNGMIRKGAAAKIIGKVKSAKVDGEHVEVEVDLTPEGQQFVDDGNRELSVGYDASLDAQRYQRGIDVDHLAAVPLGRCGAECRLDAISDCGCGCSGSTECAAAAPGPSATFPGTAMSEHGDKDLNAKERHALPAKHFAVPGSETLPIEDEGHVHAAMGRFNQTKFLGPAERKSAFHRIVARAHELGIDPKGFQDKFGGHLDDEEYMNMDASGEVPSGGGEAGRSQNSDDPGYAAPDLHAKLTEALKGYQEMQVKHDELVAKYDALLAKYDSMMKERTDASDKEIEALKAKYDAMCEERDASRKDAELATKRADAADAALKAATDKARFDADTEFTKRVTVRSNERAVLLTKANAVLGVEDRSAMSDRDVMCAVIKKVTDVEIPAEKSGDYVTARFDAAMDRASHVSQSFANARQTLHQNRLDGHAPSGIDVERAAQAEMTNRAATAWQPRK